MEEICKICAGRVISRHTIKNINYYYCEKCNFLFSLYWDEYSRSLNEQILINDEMRNKLWHRTDSEEAKRRWHEFVKLGDPGFNLSHIFWFSSKFYKLVKIIRYPTSLFTMSFDNDIRKLKDTAPVLKKIKHINNILDFGCGYGEGVEALREMGYNCIGLDPFSPSTASYIIKKPLLDAHFENNYFDVIISIETIEHIPNVIETFSELYRILKPCGGLFVQTMWLDCADYQREKDKWFYVQNPDVHVSIYSEKAINAIKGRVGFHKLKIKSPKYAVFYK